MFLARPIFQEAAKYYKIPYQRLALYSIQSLIQGKPEKFYEPFTFAWYQGEWIIVPENIIEETKTKDIESVKGNIAFKGFVKGNAKIVRSVSELGKVKKGDVLVTQMTFPSFISAMNKAVAFVTDEGGITCHAAIVAREMKKPCITGTKIATKIFKDGDFIEVDANKGIIRKIK
jgi:phosphoenolpyruvate synthase/pyruvate phosphate dikinase